MRQSRTPDDELSRIDDRASLFALIHRRSFFRRKITLVSGRESDFYFDMKPTMLDPEGASLLARLLFERLSDHAPDYVGGLALGAVPLLSPLAAYSFERGRPIRAFFVRKEIKGHGTQRRLEGLAEGESIAGKNVIVLDDVTTTGGSAMLAVDAARESGANVIGVFSVVDREEGAAEFYRGEGLPFWSLFTAGEFLQRTPSGA